MLARRQIQVGKCYVNENNRSAREIVSMDRQTVVYSHYDLDSGRLCGSPNQSCNRSEILHWADREATRREAGSLKRHERESLFRREPASTSQPPHLDDSLTILEDDFRRMSFMR